MAALEQTYGYKPFAITQTPPNEDLTSGLALCLIQSHITGNRLVSLPFADHCQPLASDNAQMHELVNYARGMQDERHLKYVELRPHLAGDDSLGGFGVWATYWFHTLSLAPELGEIFRRFHGSCIQRRIHHAERMNLKYEESRTGGALADFYRLQVLTRARHGLPPQPAKWFRNLLRNFGDGMTIHTVSANGQPVASMVTLRHGRTLTYKYGASDASLHRLGGMILLFWNVIQNAKANGIVQLDLGRSDLDSTGLTEFKDHWGATRSSISYFRFPKPSPKDSHQSRRVMLARQLFTHTPQRIAELAGALLYKHAG